LDVIVEQKTKTHGYYGAISGNYLKLLVKSDNLTARDNIKVRVTSLTDLGLMAEPLK